MAETRNKLTAVGVKALSEKGRHGDGGGLWLNVTASGTKNWSLTWRRDGRRRELGLGRYPDVSLALARQKAAEARAELVMGRDPLADRQRTAEPTFAAAAKLYIDGNEVAWRNPKHRQQWRNTLATYAMPIAAMRVSEIEADDVLRCLTSIWTTKPETASRVRGRIERVLDYSAVRGWRPRGANPAAWRGNLGLVLPARAKLARGHHAAMPWQDVPAFMVELASRKGVAAQALAFTILTAARSGEVRGATWEEIDIHAGLWTVPAERMKARRPHRVPLSEPSIAILKAAPRIAGTDLVFPGTKGAMSDMTLAAVLKRMGRGEFTVHGFRSGLRDWVSEATDFQGEVAEAALAHSVGDKTEAAYRRGELLEKRRTLMLAWGNFVWSR